MIRPQPYKRVKFSSIDGSTKVRIEKGEGFYIDATPAGLEFVINHKVDSHEDWQNFLRDFGKMVDAAQSEWLSLKRRNTEILLGR